MSVLIGFRTRCAKMPPAYFVRARFDSRTYFQVIASYEKLRYYEDRIFFFLDKIPDYFIIITAFLYSSKVLKYCYQGLRVFMIDISWEDEKVRQSVEKGFLLTQQKTRTTSYFLKREKMVQL